MGAVCGPAGSALFPAIGLPVSCHELVHDQTHSQKHVEVSEDSLFRGCLLVSHWHRQHWQSGHLSATVGQEGLRCLGLPVGTAVKQCSALRAPLPAQPVPMETQPERVASLPGPPSWTQLGPFLPC